MDRRKLIGVVFGAHPQPYHEPFLDRLRARYGVEVRYAHGQWGEHIQQLAHELVGLRSHVLVTFDTPSTIAATKATSVIPIVSQVCGVLPDQPIMGENVTGLARKELDAPQQLRALVALLVANERPLSPVGVLWNGDNAAMGVHLRDVETAAAAYAPPVLIRSLALRGPDYDVRHVLDTIDDAQALVVVEEPVVVYYRKEIVAFARDHRLPALFESLQFMEVGGLASYGPDRLAAFSRMADYVDHIVQDDLRPGNLPPTEEPESRLFINLQAAEALGLRHIPDRLDGIRWEPSGVGALAHA